MSEEARRVIELALKLTPEEQEQVVDALLAELDVDPAELEDDGEFTQEQIDEWVRRREKARAKPDSTIDADEAIAKARTRDA